MLHTLNSYGALTKLMLHEQQNSLCHNVAITRTLNRTITAMITEQLKFYQTHTHAGGN